MNKTEKHEKESINYQTYNPDKDFADLIPKPNSFSNNKYQGLEELVT